MGGPEMFEIQLQGNGIYYGGQMIHGQLKIGGSHKHQEYLSSINNIQMKILGYGEVHWTDRKSRTRRRSDGSGTEQYYETVHFRNYEEYVCNKFIVHQGPVGQGYHAFPFSLVLPPNLPSSFEGQHGHVRYVVEAKIDRSGIFSFNKRKKHFITINSIVDLNQIQGAETSQINSNSKTFGLLCCSTGPVSATVRIPRYGYTPGEIIPIAAEVENISTKHMNCTKIRLLQDVTFRATNGTKTTNRILQEVKRGPIEPGKSDTWNGQPLAIPPIPPSGFGGCRIIDISYHLEFRVDPSGMGFDLVVKIPITIGTIPLRSYIERLAAARSNHQPSFLPVGENFSQPSHSQWVSAPGNASTAPPSYPNQTTGGFPTNPYAPCAPPVPPTEYNNLPPPSYADAVAAFEDGRPNQLRSEKDSEHTDANWDFNPRYPVWSMPSAPPQ